MALSQTSVLKLYSSVIEDVINGVREAFLDEGVDEQVLQELKMIWESKLMSSKAVDAQPDPLEPPINVQKEVGKYLNKSQVVANHHQQVQSQQHQQTSQTTTHQHNQIQQSQAAQQPHNNVTQQHHQQQQQSQQQNVATANSFIQELNNKPVPIQITLPPQQGSNDLHQRVLTIQVPASALQGNQLQSVLTGSVISATMALPQHLASALLQQHVTAALQGQASSGVTSTQQQQQQIQQQQHQVQQQQQQNITNHNNHIMQQNDNKLFMQHHNQVGTNAVSQLDGNFDTSDDEDDDDDNDEDDDDDDDDIDDRDDEENEDNDGGAEEEPLNSGDDVSEEDPGDMFETDNVVVCQYDKITRSRNKWKFHFKDGIMNLTGKDFVFQKANGDAEW